MNNSVVVVLSDSDEDDDIQIIKTTPGTGLKKIPKPRPVVPVQLLCNTGAVLHPSDGIKQEAYGFQQFPYNDTALIRHSGDVKQESHHSSASNQVLPLLSNNIAVAKQEVYGVGNSPAHLAQSEGFGNGPSIYKNPVYTPFHTSPSSMNMKQESLMSGNGSNPASSETTSGAPNSVVPSEGKGVLEQPYSTGVFVKEQPNQSVPPSTVNYKNPVYTPYHTSHSSMNMKQESIMSGNGSNPASSETTSGAPNSVVPSEGKGVLEQPYSTGVFVKEQPNQSVPPSTVNYKNPVYTPYHTSHSSMNMKQELSMSGNGSNPASSETTSGAPNSVVPSEGKGVLEQPYSTGVFVKEQPNQSVPPSTVNQIDSNQALPEQLGGSSVTNTNQNANKKSPQNLMEEQFLGVAGLPLGEQQVKPLVVTRESNCDESKQGNISDNSELQQKATQSYFKQSKDKRAVTLSKPIPQTKALQYILPKQLQVLSINSYVLTPVKSSPENPKPTHLFGNHEQFSSKKEPNRKIKGMKFTPLTIPKNVPDSDLENPFPIHPPLPIQQESSMDKNLSAQQAFSTVSKSVLQSDFENPFPTQYNHCLSVKRQPIVEPDLRSVHVTQEQSHNEKKGKQICGSGLFTHTQQFPQTVQQRQRQSGDINESRLDSVCPTPKELSTSMPILSPVQQQRAAVETSSHNSERFRNIFPTKQEMPNLTKIMVPSPVKLDEAIHRNNFAKEQQQNFNPKTSCQDDSPCTAFATPNHSSSTDKGKQQNGVNSPVNGSCPNSSNSNKEDRSTLLPMTPEASKELLLTPKVTSKLSLRKKAKSSNDKTSNDTNKCSGHIDKYFTKLVCSNKQCDSSEEVNDQATSVTKDPRCKGDATLCGETTCDTVKKQAEPSNQTKGSNRRINTNLTMSEEKTEPQKVTVKLNKLSASKETKDDEAHINTDEMHYFEVDESFICCYCNFKSHHEKTIISHCEIVHKVSINVSQESPRREHYKAPEESLKERSSSFDSEDVVKGKPGPLKKPLTPGEKTLTKLSTEPFVRLLGKRVSASNPHGGNLILCIPCNFKTVLVGKMFLHLAGKRHLSIIPGLKDEGKRFLCMACALRTHLKEEFQDHLVTEDHKVQLTTWKAAGFDRNVCEELEADCKQPSTAVQQNSNLQDDDIENKASVGSESNCSSKKEEKPVRVSESKPESTTVKNSKQMKEMPSNIYVNFSDLANEKSDSASTKENPKKPSNESSGSKSTESDTRQCQKGQKSHSKISSKDSAENVHLSSSQERKTQTSSKNCSDDKHAKSKKKNKGSEKSSKYGKDQNSRPTEDSHQKSSKHLKKDETSQQKRSRKETSEKNCNESTKSSEGKAAKSLRDSKDRKHSKENFKTKSRTDKENKDKDSSEEHSRSKSHKSGKDKESKNDNVRSSKEKYGSSSKDKNHKEGSSRVKNKENKHSKKSSTKDHNNRSDNSSKKREEKAVKIKNHENKTVKSTKGTHQRDSSKEKISKEKIPPSDEVNAQTSKNDSRKVPEPSKERKAGSVKSSNDKGSKHKHCKTSKESSKTKSVHSSIEKILQHNTESACLYSDEKNCKSLKDKNQDDLKKHDKDNDINSRKRTKSDDSSVKLAKIPRISDSRDDGSNDTPLVMNQTALEAIDSQEILRKGSKSDNSSAESCMKDQRLKLVAVKTKDNKPEIGTKVVDLVTNISDFSEKPYACALCFFRSKELQALVTHVQNHLLGGKKSESEMLYKTADLKSISKDFRQPVVGQKELSRNPSVSPTPQITRNTQNIGIASYHQPQHQNPQYVHQQAQKQTYTGSDNSSTSKHQLPYRDQHSVLPVHNQIIHYTSHISQFAAPHVLTVSTGAMQVNGPNQTACLPQQITHISNPSMTDGKQQQYLAQQPQQFVQYFQENQSQCVQHISKQNVPQHQDPLKQADQYFVPKKPHQFSQQQQFVPQNPQHHVLQQQQFLSQSSQQYATQKQQLLLDQSQQMYVLQQQQRQQQQQLQSQSQQAANCSSQDFRAEDIIDAGIDFVKDPQNQDPFVCLYCNQRAQHFSDMVRHFKTVHYDIVQAKMIQAQMRARAALAAQVKSVKEEKCDFIKQEPMECQ